ncbi:MAG: 5-(carboxyamino)imidazole ribonucleotide synthase [Pseudomonadota bacterium]
MTEGALPPGAAIGILGGGQLGRMLALAAAQLGLRCHIYDPDTAAPAGQVCEQLHVARYDDVAALMRFAESVDVVTYEFENIPTAALDAIEALVPIRPGRQALEVSQDRLVEKTWLRELGLAVAPFAAVSALEDLGLAVAALGTPSILKTRRFGYDGKGQMRLHEGADLQTSLAAVGNAPSVLEGFIDFSTEISVIGSRGLDGSVACFDPGENVHSHGILGTTTVPASVSAAVATDAVLIAGRILNALDYVGVLGVEFFVSETGLIVNEIAPRVHNSGHWTQSACVIDQFQKHIRAVAGWPLGSAERFADAVMTNLIGADANDWIELGQSGDLHLYGKSEARAGRKMGHITRISPRS